MASTRAREIRVGVVTIGALVVLIGGIIWGKGIGFGTSHRLVRIKFPSAAGVDVGTTPITLNGVRKGNVTAIEAGANDVMITAIVDATYPLHQDATASLQMLELTGGKKIEIVPGASSAPLPHDAVIPGTVQGDITALLADVGDMGADAKKIIRKLDSSITMVNDLIGSAEFKQDIRSTLSNLEKSSAVAHDLVVGNRAAIDRAISNFDNTANDLRQLVSNVRPTVDRTLANAEGASADAKSAIRHVDSTLRMADTLVAHLNGLTADIKNGNGAISKLIYDKEFADEIDRTLRSVRGLIEDVQRSGIKTDINIGFGGRK
ncbi:MAG: MlaD family protein [Candidatus Kapaibacterium sp.]